MFAKKQSLIRCNQLSKGGLIGLLVLFSLSVAWAQVNPPPPTEPPGDCPLPHNNCTPACGTKCNFYTCNKPETTPSFVINSLPYKYVWWQEQRCSGRVGRELNLNELRKTYTFGPVESRDTYDISKIPTLPITLNTWACLQNEKTGPCCPFTVSPWSACSPICGFGDLPGTQTRTVTCNAPNGDCCLPRPPTQQACVKVCPPVPPPPRAVGGSIGPDRFGPTACQGESSPTCFWVDGTNPWDEAGRGTGAFAFFDRAVTVADASKFRLCYAPGGGPGSRRDTNCTGAGGVCVAMDTQAGGSKVSSYDWINKPHNTWFSYFIYPGAVKNVAGVTNTEGFCFTFRIDD